MRENDQLKRIKESLLSIMRKGKSWLLLVGTGPSVAMNSRLGMPALAKHLLAHIPDNTPGWKIVSKRLEQGDDLETALTGISLTESLQSHISTYTADFVAREDMTLRDDVLTGKKIWAGEPLLKQLMGGLSPTWPRLPVVTPNYDMLIEYACSKANIPYITGYHGGVIRRHNWPEARERLCRLGQVVNRGKRQDTVTPISCIELMKVHGSINLFRSNLDNSVFESDIWVNGCPADYTPIIAPPGDIKTQEALNFHDRLFGEALQAMDKAIAFIAIGYGFRDYHIHQKIIERIRNFNCPLIVLTLDPSDELNKLVSIGKDIWVITGLKKTNGETDPSGTCFINSKKELCGEFEGISVWQSNIFTEQILGG